MGVVLNEGANNVSSTKLDFTVNIPKTGFYDFVLRYMVRLFPYCRSDLSCKICNVMFSMVDDEVHCIFPCVS